jgi:hypothetical protein
MIKDLPHNGMLTVRSRTSDQIQTNFLGSSEEWLIRKHSLGRKVARTTFQRSPIDVERDPVITDSLDLLQDVCPEAYRR